PYSLAIPKFRQIDFACPICRKPLGSGGKRVAGARPKRPVATSSATISRMKSRERVGAVSDTGRMTDDGCLNLTAKHASVPFARLPSVIRHPSSTIRPLLEPEDDHRPPLPHRPLDPA